MKKRRPSHTKIIISLGAFVVLLSLIIWSWKENTKNIARLKNDGVVTKAVVTKKTGSGRKAKPNVHYRFVVDDVSYKGSREYLKRDLHVGDTIPVIYYVPDPGINKALLFDRDYAVFGLRNKR